MIGRIVRLAAVSLVVPFLVAAWATPACANDFRYWYAGPLSKIYSSSVPSAYIGRASSPSVSALPVSAAGSEYEGRQLVIRTGDRPLTNVWISASSLQREDGAGTIDADEVSVSRVGYVKITTPSYGFKRRGYEPDPLIPMVLANGTRIGAKYRGVSANRSQPFYVLFHVPTGTPSGTYDGTITVSADDTPALEVPVRLRVYPFDIGQRTLRTTFGINLFWARYANSATHEWLPKGSATSRRVSESTSFKADQIGGWLRFMDQHRVSPETLMPAWDDYPARVEDRDGRMVARNDYLQDYLGAGQAATFRGSRLNFNTVRVPEYLNYSWTRNPFSSATSLRRAKNYYASMKSELGPYASRGIAYPIDEPRASKRTFIEKYAALIHAYAPGVKFLVTTDPITMNYRPIKGVDIYVQRLHFYYRDYAKWVAKLRASGKSVWIYSHAGGYQAAAPNYLIDAPLASTRAQGWFAYHSMAGGLLYMDVAAWRPTYNSATYRDPYSDPLSSRAKPYFANGEGTLAYPGYHPSSGLTLQGAPPVSSLRMEALRDGLEDYEYLKLVEKKYGGRAATLGIIGSIIGKPATVPADGKMTFPSYTKDPTKYFNARETLARKLSN